MDLVVEPDLYQPSIDNNGNYVDRIPSFNSLKNGIRCPCGSRRDKLYDCSAYFTSHVKTKTHQKWLAELNANKMNYFSENAKLKQLIAEQRLIIAQMEKELNDKQRNICFLSHQLMQKHENENKVINLLDMDF